MPIVTMPDGLKVKFPDEMSKEDIGKAIQKKYPDAFKAKAEEPQEPSMSVGDQATDALIGGGSGVTNAVLNTATLPAEAATGARWLANKAGKGKEWNEFTKAAKYIPAVRMLVGGSQSLRDELAKPTTGVGRFLKGYSEFQPQSTAGKYAKTTGEFAAGALGPKAGLMTRVAKNVLLPAFASETAGQLTEGTKFEPYARVAGGLLGLGSGAPALNKLAERRAVARLPSAKHFEDTGKAAYDLLDNSNVFIKHTSMDRMLQGLTDHLADIGYVPGEHTKAAARLGKIQNDLQRGRFGSRPLSFREAESFSKSISNSIKDLDVTNKGDRRILWAAKHYVDDWLQGASSTAGGRSVRGLHNADIYNGGNASLPEVQGAIKTARANWAAKSKADLLDSMVQAGEDTGKSVYTRGGVELGTRREFLKYLRKPENKRQKLTSNELAAFRRVAQGGSAGNTLRNIGKLGSNANNMFYSGSAAAAAGTLAGSAFGAPWLGAAAGIATPVLGRMARRLSDASTRKAVADAQSVIRNGSKLKRPWKNKIATFLTLNAIRNQGGF